MKYWAEFYGMVFSIAFVAGVMGNLTASFLLGLPVVVQLHKKVDRYHREHMNAIRNPEAGRDRELRGHQ